MAATIEAALGHKAELVRKSHGIYDIHADGELVYSRKAEGNRFPEDDEIVSALRARE